MVAVKGSIDEAYQEYPNLFGGIKKQDFLTALDASPELFFTMAMKNLLDVLSEGMEHMRECILGSRDSQYLVAAVTFFRAAKEAGARDGGMELLLSANYKAHDLILRLPKTEGKEDVK